MHIVEKILHTSEYHLPIRIPVAVFSGVKPEEIPLPLVNYDVNQP